MSSPSDRPRSSEEAPSSDGALSSPSLPGDGSDGRVLRLLAEGALTLDGLLPWSSNYTFLGHVGEAGRAVPVVYKPMRGERPLWDFPRGTLAKREVAAFVVSGELGWNLVPPSVFRDGPHGRGSVQLFVDADQDAHFFTFHADPAYRSALQALALFDVISNNADRKGGHCLRAEGGRVVAIDQGLCFHVEPKLRTVIWDFAGEPIPAALTADLRRFESVMGEAEGRPRRALVPLLSPGEVGALRERLAALLADCRFPDPPEDRRPYPWPLV